MATQIVLLRGVNVGAANRIGMPALVAALAEAGFSGVRTHLQSGNLVADADPDALVAAIRAVIDVRCVARSAEELDQAIAANPFPAAALENPKLLQVTFRAAPADPAVLPALEARLSGGERVAVCGREIYSFHPDGIARSKLALALTPSGTADSARNWNTVLKLAEMVHA